jgi:hypothetical protein
MMMPVAQPENTTKMEGIARTLLENIYAWAKCEAEKRSIWRKICNRLAAVVQTIALWFALVIVFVFPFIVSAFESLEPKNRKNPWLIAAAMVGSLASAASIWSWWTTFKDRKTKP